MPGDDNLSETREPNLDQVAQTADKLYKILQSEKKRRQSDSQQAMRLRMTEGRKSFVRYVKGDYKESMQAIWDDRTCEVTIYLPRIHELFCEGREKIYSLHKGKLPNYKRLLEA